MPTFDLSFWVGLIELAQVNFQRAENEQAKLASAEILAHNLRHLNELLQIEKQAATVPVAEFDGVFREVSTTAEACERFVDQLQRGSAGTLPMAFDSAGTRQLISHLSPVGST